MESRAEAVRSVTDKLAQLRKVQNNPSIFKVHSQLRQISNEAYEPVVVSIGPYHHGKDNLKKMEQHKVRYLEAILKRTNDSVERYITAIAEIEQEARNYYDEPVAFSSAEFIEMLVLDGCFIIELAQKCDNREVDPITRTIFGGLLRDLILFENQIPFLVVCKLYDLMHEPNQHNNLMHLLLAFCRHVYPREEVPDFITNRSSKDVKHLLDLIYSDWCPTEADINITGLIEMQQIPSATELKDANVKFEMKKSSRLFDLDFKKGVLRMPRLSIEDKTESLFRNLIAYEQYFPNNRPTPVTNYAIFLDSLINTSRDVEILSQCGVIDNWRGDSEKVAYMVNRLGDSVLLRANFIYGKTFSDINAHQKKCWNRAAAVLHRDYFNSPWDYIKFATAVLLLLLTLAQTVFSGIPLFKGN